MVNMYSIKGEHLMKQILSLEIDLGDSSFLVCPHFPDLSKFIFMGDTVSEANSNNNFTIHECSSYNVKFSALLRSLLDEVDFIRTPETVMNQMNVLKQKQSEKLKICEYNMLVSCERICLSVVKVNINTDVY